MYVSNIHIHQIYLGKRASSCEKFIDYEVQTRANMFPTSQFGPILLSRACLYSARTRPHNHSLTTRLQHLIRTGKAIETDIYTIQYTKFYRTKLQNTELEKNQYSTYQNNNALVHRFC